MNCLHKKQSNVRGKRVRSSWDQLCAWLRGALRLVLVLIISSATVSRSSTTGQTLTQNSIVVKIASMVIHSVTSQRGTRTRDTGQLSNINKTWYTQQSRVHMHQNNTQIGHLTFFYVLRMSVSTSADSELSLPGGHVHQPGRTIVYQTYLQMDPFA